MTPSITFVPNKTGLAVIALPDSATNLVAVAVSVEPDGGSAQPTTKPLFVRTLE
jgi:anti-sigma-K factor RskA